VPVVRGKCFFLHGQLHASLEQYQFAVESYNQAISGLEYAEAMDEAGRLLIYRGLAWERLGSYTSAQLDYNAANGVFTSCGLPLDSARALKQLAMLNLRLYVACL
jgi:tetratricopeptide (TPR) repeat protein